MQVAFTIYDKYPINYHNLFTTSQFLDYEYLLWPLFHFCLELALSQSFFVPFCSWVHDFDHNHSLAGFQWSGSLTSERSSLRKRPTVPEIVPPQGDGSGDHVYLEWKIVQSVATKAILQPALCSSSCSGIAKARPGRAHAQSKHHVRPTHVMRSCASTRLMC